VDVGCGLFAGLIVLGNDVLFVIDVKGRFGIIFLIGAVIIVEFVFFNGLGYSPSTILDILGMINI
jgi:hypothetical protein